MIGYLVFAIPMLVAFVWIAHGLGVRQALLDLIALNLLFVFDFAALLPNNMTLLLLHVLLFALVGVESIRAVLRDQIHITRRAAIISGGVVAFVAWMVIAEYLNKREWWTVTRITTDSVFIYVLPALFMFVGIVLAKHDRFIRFCKVLLIACTLAGAFAALQTATGGHFSTYSSDNYLDVFQPFGDKAIGRRTVFIESFDQIEATKTIQFGGLILYRGEGTFEGAYVILCAAAAALLSPLTSKKRVSAWLFIPFAFSIVGFVVAFNRSGILAFALGGGLVLAARLRSLISRRVLRRWLLPFLGMALGIIIALGPISQIVLANLDGFLGSRSDELATLHGRTQMWTYVLAEIAASPIIGTGAPTTLLSVGWGDDNNPDVDFGAHNTFLQFALRGGVIPTVLFTAIFLFCVARLVQLSRHRAVPSEDRRIFFGLLAALTSFFLVNMTGSWMILPTIASLFWVICGYLAAYKIGGNRGQFQVTPVEATALPSGGTRDECGSAQTVRIQNEI